MPLFVRAGSIVPTGPDIQYTGEKPAAPITLFVYTGADGTSRCTRMRAPITATNRAITRACRCSYDEASHTLHIGAREGDGTGAPAKRQFVVHWVTADGSKVANQTVDYDGSALTVVRK